MEVNPTIDLDKDKCGSHAFFPFTTFVKEGWEIVLIPSQVWCQLFYSDFYHAAKGYRCQRLGSW